MIASSINAEKGFVIISIKGAPNLEDYVNACRALGEHENFYPETHRVCDLSQIDDLSLSTKELQAFVEEARKLPKAAGARTALIAKNAEDQAVLTLFASYFDRGSFDTFESGRDALAWVLWAAPDNVAKQESDRIRYHRLSGDITSKSAFRIQGAWFSDENYDPGAPILWDLTDARIVVDRDELSEIADEMFSLANQSGRSGRTAILVRLKFQVTILEEAFSKGIESGRTSVFTSESKAHEWLLEVER